MSVTYEEFMAQTGAEEVGGQIIVGIRGNRKVVALREKGAFNLTDEGKKYWATRKDVTTVEEKPKRGRRKKDATEVSELPESDEELERLLLEE